MLVHVSSASRKLRLQKYDQASTVIASLVTWMYIRHYQTISVLVSTIFGPTISGPHSQENFHPTMSRVCEAKKNTL